MTRACMFCLYEYGEKCPECGEAAIEVTWPGPHHLCINPACDQGSFDTGEGGITHGVCKPCAGRSDAERMAIHERAINAPYEVEVKRR